LNMWDKNLVIIRMLVLCKKCIFEHMTDKTFPVTGPLRRFLASRWMYVAYCTASCKCW